MTGPNQAVVLCGGLGTRLRPITDSLPKPMVPIDGRPFLAFLVDALQERGIRRIVLLVGYRAETIRGYFGDGSAFGVEITYSVGPVEWETGRRIWEARDILDAQFLLLYSDNFVPFNLQMLADAHTSTGDEITMLVQPKTTGNIRLSADGRVDLYDARRAATGLDYVEIGYMVVERGAALRELANPDVSFSSVLEQINHRGRLGAVVSRDPYHSVSDPQRLQLAERYLRIKRILLIDRDGTINARPPRGEYIRSWDDFHWISDTVAAMEELGALGFSFIVVSNQAGIARMVVDESAVSEINARIKADLARRGVDILDFYVCPHHWDDGCACRKPKPGLFFQASKDHLLRMDRTIYIGDDPRDARAAFNAECVSILIGPEREHDPGGGARPAFKSEMLSKAVPWIVSQFERWERAAAPRVSDVNIKELRQAK